jgi:hypothetical protein
MVPEELRAGYRVLTDAGYVPPEVESLREIRSLRSLLVCASDPQERDKRVERLRLLEMRLAEGRGRGLSPAVQQQYPERLLGSLGRAESVPSGQDPSHPGSDENR